ncbi:MAG TPA: DEAD/DEAH box helicase [Bdellovibrionota bacterium]|nr:DEAD/DEAH box helicase [Bdellovibrionota bacterium]
MNNFDQYCSAIQKQCLPGVWSKAIALSRTDVFIEDQFSPDEILYRLQLPDRPVSIRVSLWPKDEDWFCTCSGRNDICVHVAAASLILKSGRHPGAPKAAATRTFCEVRYLFCRKTGGELEFQRHLVFRAHASEGETSKPLNESLVSLSGGITSGRIAAPPLAATQDDFAADAVLSSISQVAKNSGILEAGQLAALLKVLSSSTRVFLDGEPVQTSSQPVRSRILLTPEHRGYRLTLVENESPDELFSNGAALVRKTLRPVEPIRIAPSEQDELRGRGRFYPESELARLVTEVIPRLESRIAVQIEIPNFPTAVRNPPAIELEITGDTDELLVIPRIKYDSPYAIRDEDAERSLARKLQFDHHLAVDQATRFSGIDAAQVLGDLRNSACAVLKITGSSLDRYEIHETLVPELRLTGHDFELHFTRENLRADARVVLKAWRENSSLVPLLNGGWAKLPKDWLARYGEQVERLLLAKSDRQGCHPVSPHFMPEFADFCSELANEGTLAGEEQLAGLRLLKERLDNLTRIPEAPLPADLKADLRPYQRSGINWLCFLRDAGLSALLADDMGLGKTLQALCAIHGRTLIITPTSVLHAWARQIETFRPTLRFQVYHGAARQLAPEAQVVLTTYGLLRSDREILSATAWDTAVLDESQTIKNPDSQVAKAAHAIRANFRVALTGTPIENRLEDLWSQFEFLAPGYLGERKTFAEAEARQLSKRVKPFILRRLKRDVALELPPRIETVLECEFSETERAFYDSILAATRADVLQRLELRDKGNVLAALEALLRLRQACCDPALVPGHPPELATAPSSKIELLLESLEQSIGAGHRALVFSQWTSLLDRIEPALKTRNIPFSRLDGSTPKRQEIVEQFQNPEGPPVMLISLKAGGLGLTLTAADHIYLTDPWWNPAVEDQAADRAHRIGQKNPVLIHRLIASQSVEERIIALQRSKRELAKAVLTEGDSSDAAFPEGEPQLTREDLIELLT